MIDVSVLILFFNRPEPLAQVFAAVREAQPTRLFLYQDGPRNEQDLPGIEACREVVSKIDWDCEVHTKFQEKNFGCDPSEFISQRWVFSITDKCIVLEDDDVPSPSFFPFCKEMLDRYENDERITMIAGFNTDEDSTPYMLREGNTLSNSSYFFTHAFSIWGWASWSRVVNKWDGNYGFVHDAIQWEQLQTLVKKHNLRRDLLALCQQHAATRKEYYETIFWAYMALHEGLAIMPRVNLINNIGLSEGTHYSTQLALQPRRLRRQFEMQRLNLMFPLTHPSKVIEYPAYQQRYHLLNAWGHPWRKVQYSFEELWLNLKHGQIRNIFSAIKKRIKKYGRAC